MSVSSVCTKCALEENKAQCIQFVYTHTMYSVYNLSTHTQCTGNTLTNSAHQNVIHTYELIGERFRVDMHFCLSSKEKNISMCLIVFVKYFVIKHNTWKHQVDFNIFY